jgi:hypothetical protein
MNRTIYTLLLAICLPIGEAIAQEITTEFKVSGYTEEDAVVAINMLRRNCRPLGSEFWPDVVHITATFEKEEVERRQALGWLNSLELQIRYSDEPTTGPGYASGAGVLAGQTLYYRLGGGDRPGFFVSKRSSQYMCGLSFDDSGADLFVDVPGLNFIDR